MSSLIAAISSAITSSTRLVNSGSLKNAAILRNDAQEAFMPMKLTFIQGILYFCRIISAM